MAANFLICLSSLCVFCGRLRILKNIPWIALEPFHRRTRNRIQRSILYCVVNQNSNSCFNTFIIFSLVKIFHYWFFNFCRYKIRRKSKFRTNSNVSVWSTERLFGSCIYSFRVSNAEVSTDVCFENGCIERKTVLFSTIYGTLERWLLSVWLLRSKKVCSIFIYRSSAS